eukprot:296834-Rhodomonas_salina.1
MKIHLTRKLRKQTRPSELSESDSAKTQIRSVRSRWCARASSTAPTARAPPTDSPPCSSPPPVGMRFPPERAPVKQRFLEVEGEGDWGRVYLSSS